jgi:TorA maturation chaperone TorD/Pyruvate/2-oxoacid:ferredoxin oxidoreductase delta subunit
MDTKTARQRSRTYTELAHAFLEAEPGLEREYTRLFLGPGRPVAHTHESVYREGRMMGETTLDVRNRLTTEGLAPGSQTLPDHVGIELAFMAHLAAREALAWADGDEKTARGYLAQQGSFLRDHLAAWLPQFCSRVLAGRPHDHYADLTRRVEAFVTDDVVRVGKWLGNGAGAAIDVNAERDWWVVALSEGCTLCDICVQVCRPGALKRIRHAEDGTILLHFEAAQCDGCASCQRWCPEAVIRVSRVGGGERPFSGELARSAMLACPRCGKLHAPAAMVTKVQAQAGTANEALAQRLTLCADCKLLGTPFRRHSIGAANQPEPQAQTPAEGLSREAPDAPVFQEG